MESLLWASECFNRSATAANGGWLSLHGIFYGSRPPLPLLPFFQPVYHRVPGQRKSNPRARLCHLLNFGYNYVQDCHKLLGAETGKVVFSCDVTWHHPERVFDPSGNCSREFAHCATGGYLRTDANAWCPRSPRLLPLQYRLRLRWLQY